MKIQVVEAVGGCADLNLLVTDEEKNIKTLTKRYQGLLLRASLGSAILWGFAALAQIKPGDILVVDVEAGTPSDYPSCKWLNNTCRWRPVPDRLGEQRQDPAE